MTYFTSKRHMLLWMGNTLIWCFRKAKFHDSGENCRAKFVEKKNLEVYELNLDFC